MNAKLSVLFYVRLQEPHLVCSAPVDPTQEHWVCFMKNRFIFPPLVMYFEEVLFKYMTGGVS
jgi:hypothetical protein